MGEEVGRSPEETDARLLLVAGRLVHQRVEVRAELRERVALRGDIPIVEAVVGDVDLREELECDSQLRARVGHRVPGAREPGPVQRADPEHVEPGPGERVPEADAGPEVVLHPLSEHDPILVVDLEGQWVRRVETLVSDRLGHLAEERFAHAAPSSRNLLACSAQPSTGDL